MTAETKPSGAILSLTQYIFEQNREQTRLSSELVQLLITIVTGVKHINNLVSVTSQHGVNPGNLKKIRKKLDLESDKIFLDLLSASGHFSLFISEERKTITATTVGHSGSEYVVAFDALDGVSNLGTSIPVGSIFSIYQKKDSTRPAIIDDFLQPASNIIAAGYAIYGAKTTFVLTLGQGVFGFTLDRAIGEFILTDSLMQVPQQGSWFSVNEGYQSEWPDKLTKYLNKIKSKPKHSPDKLMGRYVGSLVVDFDRNLREGGILIHPESTSREKGRLRLLFECIPLAFIMNQAGGIASDGQEDILNKTVRSTEEYSPLYIGGVNELEEFFSEAV
jgi:fructose-1,6-bisphosphatase I